jgi:hypothetical protein
MAQNRQGAHRPQIAIFDAFADAGIEWWKCRRPVFCAVANASCDVARGAEFASGLASFGANRKRSAGDQNGVFESRTSCRIPPDC